MCACACVCVCKRQTMIDVCSFHVSKISWGDKEHIKMALTSHPMVLLVTPRHEKGLLTHGNVVMVDVMRERIWNSRCASEDHTRPRLKLTAPGRYSTCVLCYTYYIILDFFYVFRFMWFQCNFICSLKSEEKDSNPLRQVKNLTSWTPQSPFFIILFLFHLHVMHLNCAYPQQPKNTFFLTVST